MAIGLLGLVGLQLYWISSALRLQKEQFAYKVTDALQEVVRTLERQEIAYMTKQHIQAREQKNRLMAIAKKGDKPVQGSDEKVVMSDKPIRITLPKRVSRPINPSIASRQRVPSEIAPAGAMVVQSDALHPVVHPLSAEQAAIVQEFFRQQAELMAVGDWETQLLQQQQFSLWVERELPTEISRYTNQLKRDSLLQVSKKRIYRTNKPRKSQPDKTLASTNPASATRPVSVSQNKADEQSHMIKEVVKGLLMSDRPIEERINRLALDTLLRQTLDERGIRIPFTYAVRTRQAPTFLFASANTDIQQLSTDGYKAALFPNNILETGNYVYVYFPTQQQFILSRLGFTFGASVVLILVILACFYIAISTIVRQKKLADIKNDFINNMTHELKTPISTISLAVEMAQEQLRSESRSGMVSNGRGLLDEADEAGKLDSRLTRYMNIIRDETRRLGSHVEKVLQMALMDRGEIKLNLSSVNVHDVIEKVLNNLSLQIEQRGGEVDLHFDADREVVEADELHLTNIVYNLLDNALKYSPENPHITLTTRSLPEGVSITVADQGVGMTKDQTSRIFEKFYRVPTGNRHDVKGFGLGLSYVKKMIDEHHGQILVESHPGKGSSFDVILPYKIVNE
jgi:two-component system phosphate regulon sensor histidine kinase PhoR